MGDVVRELSGTPGAHSPPPPAHTDSHTEVQSDPAYMPLIYLTFNDWRTTIPRANLENMTLAQQYESYQRLIMLLTRLSAREMPEGSPIPFPNYAIVPHSGRPVDVVRATEDFVDTQDLRHDLRLSECRFERMQEESSTNSEELATQKAKISRLKGLLEEGAEHFERQGLKRTVLFKEFTIMKEWKEVLGDAIKSGAVLRGFTSQPEMADVLKKVEKSITNRESQLVEEGILPLVQAPQTAKRLAANILTTSVGGSGSGLIKDSRENGGHSTSPGSPRRNPQIPNRPLEDKHSNPPPCKKRKTE